MRGYLVSIRMANKKNERKSGGKDEENMESLCGIGGNAKWYSHHEKQGFPQTLKNIISI